MEKLALTLPYPKYASMTLTTCPFVSTIMCARALYLNYKLLWSETGQGYRIHQGELTGTSYRKRNNAKGSAELFLNTNFENFVTSHLILTSNMIWPTGQFVFEVQRWRKGQKMSYFFFNKLKLSGNYLGLYSNSSLNIIPRSYIKTH